MLLRHLDGAADRATEDHLQACAYCRERADELARVEAKLRASLFRVACPPAQELGEFNLGGLSRSRKNAIRRHLETCPHCSKELLQLDEYLQLISPEAPPAVPSGLRVLVAQLLSGPLLPPALATAAARVRGEPGEPYVYQAGDARIVVDVQEDASRVPGKILLGLITGVPTRGWTVALGMADDPNSQTAVNEAGNFVMPIPPQGPYSLRVRGSGVEIQIEVPDPPLQK